VRISGQAGVETNANASKPYLYFDIATFRSKRSNLIGANRQRHERFS